jgi:signal transduction histidine kinase
MEAMGGRVTVTSEPGRGSFFVLHFPVSEPAER